MSTDTPGASLRAALARQTQDAHLLAATCPSRAVLSHLTSRWGFLVTFASGVLMAVAGVRGRRHFHHGQGEALAADVDAETAHAWGESPGSPGPR